MGAAEFGARVLGAAEFGAAPYLYFPT